MNEEQQGERREARERFARRLLRLLTTPLFGTKERFTAFPYHLDILVEFWRTADNLPPVLAERLLVLLLDLRAQRITPAEFWSRWEALPVGEPNQLAALRDFVRSWLYWRERGIHPGMGGWAQEDPERMVRRTVLDQTIERLERKYRPSEVAAVSAPDAQGDEASPAEGGE